MCDFASNIIPKSGLMTKAVGINSKLPKQFIASKILFLVSQRYTYLVDFYCRMVNLVSNCIHIEIGQIIISGLINFKKCHVCFIIITS